MRVQGRLDRIGILDPGPEVAADGGPATRREDLTVTEELV